MHALCVVCECVEWGRAMREEQGRNRTAAPPGSLYLKANARARSRTHQPRFSLDVQQQLTTQFCTDSAHHATPMYRGFEFYFLFEAIGTFFQAALAQAAAF